MAREKFIYNQQTLRYEKFTEPLKTKILRVTGFLGAVLLVASILFSFAFTYMPSPQEEALQRELNQMKDKFTQLNQQMEKMSLVLENVQERDANVHRTVFGMEPIDESIWNGGIGGHNMYSDLTQFKNTGKILVATQNRIDEIKRKLVVQSKSLDSLEIVSKDWEDRLASIPSVKPVRSDRLKRNIRLLSGFGRRIDPFTKVPRMHKGIDFTAPTGTPVYATGDGKVVRVEYKKSGYGKNIVIRHGYGYETLYAHMNEIEVTLGQKVKKGQQIGEVGNTGRSTAPHLHYEVHLNGNAVNPLEFCLDKLTPNEYQVLVDMASTPNQSFD